MKISWYGLSVLFFLLLGSTAVFAQTSYVSAASGNWNTAATWTPNGVPGSADNVTVSAAHTISIDLNASVNNLSFAASTSKLNFNVASKTLSVYGNITGVSASDDYVTAANGSNASGTKLIITGSAAQTITLVGGSTNWPDLEVNKSSGTLTLTQNTRVDGNLIITAGTVDCATKVFSMSPASTVSVASGATLSNVGRFATTTSGTTAIGSLTVDGTISGGNFYLGTLTVNNGGVLDMNAATTGFSATNPTTMTCNSGSTVKYTASGAQTGRFVNYYHLELSGTLNKTISAVGSITIGGNLTMAGSAVLLTGGTVVVSGTTSFAGTSGYQINASNSVTFNGNVTSSSITNGAIRYGGDTTTTPTATFNGDVTTTGSALFINSNSGNPTTTGNRLFAPIINFNGNVYVDVANTFISVSSTQPSNLKLNFGGTNKIFSISTGGSSLINLRGNVTFTTSREIQTNAGTYLALTFRPNSVTPEWTVKIDNGVTLTIASGASVATTTRSFADGTGAGNVTVNGELRIGQAGGWNSVFTNTGTNTLGGASTITYNGSSAQVTGSTLPASVANISLSNTLGVTLSSALTVTGTATVATGVTLATGANTLTNSGTMAVNGTFQISEGGWATGNPFTYGAAGKLVFANSTNYGINDDPPSYWPSSNAPFDVTIPAAGVTLNSINRTIAGTLILNGGVVNGDGLTLNGTTQINTGGYVTGSPSYGASSTLIYNVGSGGYTSSDEWPSSDAPANVTILNATPVILSGSRTVSTALTLTSGKLILGSNNLTVPTISGASASAYVVAIGSGELRRTVSSTGSVSLPIGDASNYTPAVISITAADGFSSAYIGGRVTASKHGSNSSTTDYLNRYWSISGNGITVPVYNVSLNYVDTDIAGTEGNIYLGKYDSGWILANAADVASNTISGTGFTAFSDFTGGENSVMPVELSSFSAASKGNTVELKWNTATELNNHGFDVERRSASNELSPANNWTKVSFIPGTGSTNTASSYSYTDVISVNGKYSYRLKQIDNNGAGTYSMIVEANVIAVPDAYTISQNFPNPFNPSTSINFTVKQTEHASVKVFDITGRDVATLFNDVAQNGQLYTVQFNASRFASGVYFYVISTKNFRSVKRMMLLK
ncbi:MAG: T9SS type A sorting domain-containing protein [Bacteroidota bacterium]